MVTTRLSLFSKPGKVCFLSSKDLLVAMVRASTARLWKTVSGITRDDSKTCKSRSRKTFGRALPNVCNSACSSVSSEFRNAPSRACEVLSREATNDPSDETPFMLRSSILASFPAFDTPELRGSRASLASPYVGVDTSASTARPAQMNPNAVPSAVRRYPCCCVCHPPFRPRVDSNPWSSAGTSGGSRGATPYKVRVAIGYERRSHTGHETSGTTYTARPGVGPRAVVRDGGFGRSG